MLAKKLIDEIKNETEFKTIVSFNLNFKIEGEEAKKFDSITKTLKKSRTELAKFIIVNSLDDLIEQLDNLNIDDSNKSIKLDDSEDAIIKYTSKKITNLNIGQQFELKELIAEDWDNIGEHGNKNKAGKIFKKLIDSGHIKNVKFIHTKTNNHSLYERI
jgi:hypothetical protein